MIPAEGPIGMVSRRLVNHRIKVPHTVFRNSAFRAVQVDLGFFEELVLRELSRHNRLGEGIRNVSGLLHDVLQVAGDFESRA